MHTKRNKLLTKFKKLEELDYEAYKTLLKSFCQHFHVEPVNVNILVDELVKLGYSDDYKRVTKKLDCEIELRTELNEIYSMFLTNLDNLEKQKNSDQVSL